MSFSEWKRYKLEEVLDLKSGKSRPKETGEYPVYGGNGILDYANRFNASDETIVIGRVGAYCGSVYFENRNIWISDNALYAKSKIGFNSKFLYYYLKLKNLNAIAGGSSHPLLTQGQLNNIEVELPNEGVQKKIASILSSLDDKIEINRQTNQTLETLAQTLFKEMCLPKSEVLPEGWSFGKLGEICNISSGKGLKREQFTENGFDVLGANGRIGFTDNYLIDDEFILTGRVGTLGTFQLVYEKCWISDNVLALKPINKNSLHYVYFWLKTIDFNNLNRGSTQPLVTKTDLQSLEVIFPNELIVEKFNILSRSLFEQIKSNNKETQTLIILRDSLLPKLMKGEIDVNNYETV